MKEKLQFVRLPIVLVLIFFLGRLMIGAALGVSQSSYDLANRVFSMVILQVHAGLLWAAVGRRYRGYTLSESVKAVVWIAVVAQTLILAATALSYIAGADTFFNFPAALNSTEPVPFGEAVVRRTATFIVNCILTGIAGALGWGLGSLIPGGGATERAVSDR